MYIMTRVLHGSGSGKIPPENRGSTAGAGRTTTLHSAGVSGAGLTAAGIPRDRDSESHPRFHSRPIVTAVQPIFTIITVFIMLPIFGTVYWQQKSDVWPKLTYVAKTYCPFLLLARHLTSLFCSRKDSRGQTLSAEERNCRRTAFL